MVSVWRKWRKSGRKKKNLPPRNPLIHNEKSGIVAEVASFFIFTVKKYKIYKK